LSAVLRPLVNVVQPRAFYSVAVTVSKRSVRLSTSWVTGTKYMTAAKATVASQATATVQFGYRALIAKPLSAEHPTEPDAHRGLGYIARAKIPAVKSR
jgi:hypothetical protein